MKTKILPAILLLITSVQALAIDSSEVVQILNGKKIHLVAPASGVTKETLLKLQGIQGLNTKVSMDCFDSSSPFHSGSDRKRLKCLKAAINDRTTDVIWCLKGGYGSSKLISELQKLPKPDKEKIFIGYSDITALHLFLSQEWGWKTIHGAIALELLKDDKEISSMQKLARLVSAKSGEAVISDLTPINAQAKTSAKIAGKLTGGNLTIVQTSIGTDWEIQSAGKILFFEDTGAKPYQIDRTLYHLQQSGVFKGVKAIIFGSFGTDDEATIKVLQNFAKEIAIPVFKTDKFGHEKFNDPIIYNADSEVSPAGQKGYFNLVMR